MMKDVTIRFGPGVYVLWIITLITIESVIKIIWG